MTYSVTLSDDHPIFREGLVHSIEETGDFKVVATGASADEAVAITAEHRPHIALLDLSMPGNGITAAERIRHAGTASRIAMLTASEVPEDISAALNAGATGYILKGVSAVELRAALMKVALGEIHVTSGVIDDLQEISATPAQSFGLLDTLSPREIEVLKALSRGLSNREIGETLNLQEKTVKHYLSSVLSKLKVRNRVEAANFARDAWRR